MAELTAPAYGIFGIGWVFLGRTDGLFAVCGFLVAAMAAVAVYCTGMIYASLKPIHQWHNDRVVPNYLALALMTGALWLNALLQLWSQPNAGVAILALLAIALAKWLKDRYWRFVDTNSARSTPETAIGLLGRGTVRPLDRPHTNQNYLLREMGFVIARKLRRIALVLGFAVPLVLTLLAALLGGPLGTLASVLAALSVMAGVLAERWLFFAEARHTVTLCYAASVA